MKITENTVWRLSFLSWFVTLLGIAGSLFFSEVLDYRPCELCWYQRIFLYPIFFIILVGIIRTDFGNNYYVIPISISGFIISLYHNLVFYEIISQELTPCKDGISCTERQLDWLGFISIPLLSLVGFTTISLISGFLIYANKCNRIELQGEKK